MNHDLFRTNLICLALFSIVSLSFDGCNHCTNNVKKELIKQGYAEEDIPENMHDAIVKYDYMAARMYANCEYDFVPEELTMSEVSYKITNGAYEAALATAREDNRPDIYSKQFADALNKMIGNGQLDEALSALSSWTFAHSPTGTNYYWGNSARRIDDKKSVFGESKYEWELYNAEAGMYNGLVVKLINSYLLKGDKEVAQKCLLLFAPFTKKNDNGELVQINSSQEEINKQKLKDLE